MKRETIINSNTTAAKPDMTEGLKRKCDKCKNTHTGASACTFRRDLSDEKEVALNDCEVTSSYSNTDPIQKEIIGCTNGSKGFSSLIFMSKRMNQITNNEYLSKYIPKAEAGFGDTKNVLEEEKLNFASVDECLEVIKQNVPQANRWPSNDDSKAATTTLDASKDRQKAAQTDSMFTFNDHHDQLVCAVKYISKTITDSDEVCTSDNDNLWLNIDLDCDKSRELMQTLSKVTLPEIFTLKISNFYESDEDLEAFLTQSVDTVWNFIFISESFCVDIHDYLTNILQIGCLKNLYLKGFMVDNEDWERIFSASNIECVIFESCNLGIDEDFQIAESGPKGSEAGKSILSRIRFIDDEMDKETMSTLLEHIKNSSVADSLRAIELNNWQLAPADVKNVAERLSLNIIVQ